MLDKNENPYPYFFELIPPKLFNRYPDASYSALKDLLSKKYGLTPTEFSLGNGSDEVLFNAVNAFTQPYDTLITIEPTFGEYKRMAEIRGLTYKPFHLQFPYAVAVDDFIQFAKQQNPALTILCNPNNPTGSILFKEDLIKIIDNIPGYIIVDEAYIDFGGSSVIDAILNYEKLIVLRTLSKGYGLAGLRFGFSIASQATTSKIEWVRAPYNLSTLTVSAIEQLLTKEPFAPQRVEDIVKMRSSIERTLEDKNVTFIPSFANFILVKPKSFTQLKARLQEAKIEVRYFDERGLIRFTIGCFEENVAWLKILLEAEEMEI